MNGLYNGLYDGLLTGQSNGLFDGLDNGLHNGLFANESSINDSDAQRFINAIGTLTNQQALAVNILTNQLKFYNLWNKVYAIYPIVGGTSTSHKWNLKDVRDLSVAYRLSFFGGLTHNSAGITGNGTNAYIDTNLNDNSILRLDDACVFGYSSTNIAANSSPLFSTYEGSTNAIFINPRNASDIMSTRMHNSTVNSTSNTDSRGFYSLSRVLPTSYILQKNNTFTQINDASVSKQNNTIIGLGSPQNAFYSTRNLSFFGIVQGLNIEQSISLYNVVQNYQRLLNRAV